MRRIYKNIPYFFREAKTIFKMDLLSNILSLLSISLIFLILSLIIAGWWISDDIIQVIEQETEISVYYDEGISQEDLNSLLSNISNIQGIKEASIVNEEESYSRMVDILGREASILEYFDDNPFSPFVEVKIEMEGLDNILEDLESIDDIEYIRDNRQVIEKLQAIVDILEVLGMFLVLAVGISTIIIISHIIRQGIYNNRDEINTLKLLGGPNYFIQLPFYIEGMFLTIIGGLIASGLWTILVRYGYSNIDGILPFLPLPDLDQVGGRISIFIIIFSILIGFIGAVFGLKSIKRENA